MAWCLAQPADWWVASAWASPSALQQKKRAAGHKVRLLSYGEEIRGQFERAASSILVELLFQRVHCTSGRDIGIRRGGGGGSRNPPVSRRHRSNFCGISAEESRQPQNIRPRDARCFYKNHGDQSRSFALTRRGFFSCWVSFFTHTIRVFLILLKSDDGFMFSHFSNKSM